MNFTEDFHIDKVNHVRHDADSAEFAKHYAAAKKGDHRPGGPKGKDEHHSETFHNTYTAKPVRHGFGGSGETHYTHNTTGDTFKVVKHANGETFYGSDHSISKLPKTEETNHQPMNAQSQIRSVAETYFEMQSPTSSAPAPTVRPTWVPEAITEAQLGDFTKLVIEARTNGDSLVEFDGKKYVISVNESENKSGLEAGILASNVADKKKSEDKKSEAKNEETEADIQKKTVDAKRNLESDKQAMKAEEFPAKKDDEPKADDDKKADEPAKDDDDKKPEGDEPDGDELDDQPAPDAEVEPAKHDSHAKKALDGDKFSRESVEEASNLISKSAEEIANRKEINKDYPMSIPAAKRDYKWHAAHGSDLSRTAFGRANGVRAEAVEPETFQQRGASILSVAAAYAEMVGDEVKPGALIEEVLTEAKPAPIVQKQPEVVADEPTKKAIEDAKKNTKVEEDPAKKKLEVKVEKKAEKPAPDASSPALPKVDAKEAVVAAPEVKTSEAAENATKGKPVATHVGPAVVENPTGAEKISQAPLNKTHPSDAQGATKYPDLVDNPPFPSQAKSVIGANEETAPKGEVVAEDTNHWQDHYTHLGKAADSMSAHAAKTDHPEHHEMAAHLHDLAHMATAASETDAENAFSHKHNDAANFHRGAAKSRRAFTATAAKA